MIFICATKSSFNGKKKEIVIWVFDIWYVVLETSSLSDSLQAN